MPAPICVFCLIANKQRDAFLLYETDTVISFLDRRPVFAGHSLIIPKVHIDVFDNLPPALMQSLLQTTQKISLAIQNGLSCDGTFIAMNNRVSQSVPHLHFHVIPRRYKDGLRGFFWPRHPYEDPQEMQATRQKIVDAL